LRLPNHAGDSRYENGSLNPIAIWIAFEKISGGDYSESTDNSPENARSWVHEWELSTVRSGPLRLKAAEGARSSQGSAFR
jgi:hypothetical protein